MGKYRDIGRDIIHEGIHGGLHLLGVVSPKAKALATQLDAARARDLQEAQSRFDLPRYPVGTTKDEIFADAGLGAKSKSHADSVGGNAVRRPYIKPPGP